MAGPLELSGSVARAQWIGQGELVPLHVAQGMEVAEPSTGASESMQLQPLTSRPIEGPPTLLPHWRQTSPLYAGPERFASASMGVSSVPPTC